MDNRVDLHIHTNFSDGLLSPGQLLEAVRQKQLAAFAVTDHDTIKGYEAIRELLADGDPKLVPGVELSVSYNRDDIHVLAYCFDPDHEVFNRALRDFQKNRNQRARRMVEKLNELGVQITFEQVEEGAVGTVIGRPHVAEAMARAKAVPSYESAFAKYIGDGKPAYVPKPNFSPSEAIDLIHKAGGVAILAHPMIENRIRHLEMFVDLGLDGIEVYHSFHNRGDVDRLKHLADRYRLLVSGGSDYHGREGRFGDIGSQKVPMECLDKIETRAQRRRESV
jgi:predicted metal-dependent phosphoesterase TrpH